jgi:hydroxymethylpyrimidine pyrophosphatase-like HAD family hydrolase
MSLPIKLISTDFDGTIHAEFEDPPIARVLQRYLASLQKQGVIWVINTGRGLSSLLEEMGRSHLTIKPDWLILVEREIYFRDGGSFVPLEDWNNKCSQAHTELFKSVKPDVPKLTQWVSERFPATMYADEYCPFCVIAEDNHDATMVQEHLTAYAQTVPGLAVVRNDVYIRFSHVDYNKGTALAKVSRLTSVTSEHVLVAGDHFNDLPMLSGEFAKWMIAPANAVDVVKEAVRWHEGYISHEPFGHGVARGLEHYLIKFL